MRYAEQKRPQKTFSLAAALAVNGSIIAAIMLSPMVVNPPEKKPRTTVTAVEPEKIPPERSVARKADPQTSTPVDVPSKPFDFPVDKSPPTPSDDPSLNSRGFKDGKGDDAGFGLEILPKEPPPLPIFKRATRDDRFADDSQPIYPSRLLLRKIEGSALIRVLVGTDGRVRQAMVVSATHPDFGNAAVKQAMKAWRFKPATRGGKPVEDWVTLPISFVIN